MFRLFDRYILKEIFPPFFIGLLVYTFVLLMNQILLLSEMFIAKGVSFRVVLSLLVYLIPSVLAFTVPMSVLMGILAGMSRMSSDVEITAFKTLGISYKRLLLPVLIFSFCGWLVTSFLTLYLAPLANYKWVQIFAQSIVTKVQFDVRPREFNETIPKTVLYIQDISREKGWKNIFVFFSDPPEEPRIIFAHSGRLQFFEEEKSAILDLFDGTVHSYPVSDPEKYRVTTFKQSQEKLDVESLFSTVSADKRVREKTIKELMRDQKKLKEEIDKFRLDDRAPLELWRKNRNFISHWVEIYKKYALPFACFIFAFLGISLGASTKKGGRTSGFTISIAVIIIYYILITAGEQLALDGTISPFVGMWGPNILLLMFGLYFFIKSLKESPFLVWLRRILPNRIPFLSADPKKKKRRLPRISVPFPNILDRYIIRKYLSIFFLVFFSLLSLSIIVTFFERLDNVYEHQKPLTMFFTYIWYRVPEFIHSILPVAALTTALLALGLLTKFNEITAMKACGISVYRITLPVLFLACLVSLSSYYLQENILPYSNKKAEDVWSRINDRPPVSFSTAARRWVMGRNRDRMYHYLYFDPIVTGFSKFTVLDFDPDAWSLKRLVYAEKAYLVDNTFSLGEGWLRSLADNRPTAFVQRERFDLEVEENRDYFLRISKIPEQMSYNELRTYIRQIKEKDFESVRFEVDLRSKISFPLASLVMVLLGIPFAFTMGKRGTLVGIGLSFVIAMIYWGAIAIFKSLGYIGYLSPFLAAWGPTFIFGAIGLYFILNVRT